MSGDLVERVADFLNEWGVGDFAYCEGVAKRIIPLVATALRQELPDEIDLFRIIRNAGRSDKAKAQAVAAAIRAGDDK
jgi:hypothetical protein